MCVCVCVCVCWCVCLCVYVCACVCVCVCVCVHMPWCGGEVVRGQVRPTSPRKKSTPLPASLQPIRAPHTAPLLHTNNNRHTNEYSQWLTNHNLPVSISSLHYELHDGLSEVSSLPQSIEPRPQCFEGIAAADTFRVHALRNM